MPEPDSGRNRTAMENREFSEMVDQRLDSDSVSALTLTSEGYNRLKEELEHLTTVKRPDIAERIRESQQHGEYSEDNNELDEVKFEQAMVENRIGELKQIFGNATVLEMDQIPTDYVGIGSLVTVTDLEYDDQFTVRLVSTIEADPNADRISDESPMGQAIFGGKAGETVEFMAPDGIRRYRIDSISK